MGDVLRRVLDDSPLVLGRVLQYVYKDIFEQAEADSGNVSSVLLYINSVGRLSMCAI